MTETSQIEFLVKEEDACIDVKVGYSQLSPKFDMGDRSYNWKNKIYYTTMKKLKELDPDVRQ